MDIIVDATSNVILSDDEIHFEPELDRKYSCPVCISVLKDPVQTRCGHRFCTSCIAGAVRRQDMIRCPVDNTWIHRENDVFLDTAVKREILSLVTLCSNTASGCSWKGEFRDFDDHNAVCLFASVPCPCSCGHTCQRQNLFQHLLLCPNRLEPCQHCHENVAAMIMTKHLLLHCPKFPVNCSLCGESGILREDISRHTDREVGTCPRAVVNCQYAWLGCKSQRQRDIISLHYEDDAAAHVEILSRFVSTLAESQKQNSTVIQEYKTKCETMSIQLQRQERRLSEQERTIAVQCEQLKQIKLNSK
ncbi:TNF receptor-associated factor 6-like [Tubulanus polymorphus]|uniref:TNF receptor-associated factor 6-like n=1 Tax=Tubulanus polymorphus TaxID=672921 RepID=UPI003DA63519